MRVSGANVTLTSIDPSATAADVRASLRVPLSAFLTGGLDGGMVFYAAEPHAFYHYAGDFVPLLGPAICLLADRPGPQPQPGRRPARRARDGPSSTRPSPC